MARRALFLFASDRMGGSERLTRALARQAAVSGEFDEVECFVLCGDRTGGLDGLGDMPNVSVCYTLKRSQWGGVWKCLRKLGSGRFDLVFSSQTFLNSICSALRYVGYLRTGRLVTRESTMIFERDFGVRTRLIRLAYRIYGSQDLIICQSERMRLSLVSRTPGRMASKCRVLGNPVDVDLVKAEARTAPPALMGEIPSDGVLIAWCGRLIPVKAPLLALEVLRRLLDAGYSQAHLVMIGDGPLRGAIAHSAADLGLKGHLSIAGFTDRPAAILSRCRIGLVTSEVEGFPNVILEMLAAGIPAVVTTDCAGGLGEIPGVTVVKSAEPGPLAEVMVTTLARPAPEGVDAFLASRTVEQYFHQVVAS